MPDFLYSILYGFLIYALQAESGPQRCLDPISQATAAGHGGGGEQTESLRQNSGPWWTWQLATGGWARTDSPRNPPAASLITTTTAPAPQQPTLLLPPPHALCTVLDPELSPPYTLCQSQSQNCIPPPAQSNHDMLAAESASLAWGIWWELEPPPQAEVATTAAGSSTQRTPQSRSGLGQEVNLTPLLLSNNYCQETGY